MMFFALAALVGVLGLTFAKWCRVGFGGGLFLANASVILVLHIAGLCGFLRPGVFLLLFSGVVSLFFLVRDLLAHGGKDFGLLRSPALLAYLCFVGFIFVWNYGRVFTHWDEFTHWGLVVKNMFLHDTFGNIPEATTLFRGYPPAASLYIYFFEELNGEFDESLAYMSYGLLLFGALMINFEAGFKEWGRQTFAMAFIAFILPVMFYGAEFYSKLYVDALLGLLFSGILVQYFNAAGVDRILSFRLAISCCTLVLVKESGVFLASLGIAITCGDFLLNARKGKLKEIVWLLVPVIGILLARFSWVNYLELTSNDRAWNTSRLTPGAVWSFVGAVPEEGKMVLVAFINAFYDQFAAWIVMIIALLSGLFWLRKGFGDSKRVLILGGGLMTGFAIYLLSLLLLYVFTFAPEEAVAVASFHRYVATFVLGAIAAVLGIGLASVSLGARSICLTITTLAVCLGTLYLPLFAWRFADKKFDRSQLERFSHFKKISGNLDPDLDKICYVTEARVFGDFGFFVARYYATPVRVDGCSDPSVSEDRGTMKPAPSGSGNGWTTALASSYSHVYLSSYSKEFRNEFGSLFESPSDIEPGALFRVVVDSGDVLLRHEKSF
jgi:hypothetical protein